MTREEPNDDCHSKAACSVLATDLDGTLIPLPGDPQNRSDLATLSREIQSRGVTLIYITGRSYALASQGIREFQLPQPDWLICDVGTSIYQRETPGRFVAIEAYQRHQDRITASLPINALQEKLESIEGLRLQEAEKQGKFKLSYYADASLLDPLVGRVRQELVRMAAPYSLVHSVDPFNGDGLIDLLPATVSKAHALQWWVELRGLRRGEIVFAGDSGNDLAAFTAGYRAIVVGNADRSIANQASQAHQQSAWNNRLYLARNHATSGVLEGCRWFGLVKSLDESQCCDNK